MNPFFRPARPLVSVASILAAACALPSASCASAPSSEPIEDESAHEVSTIPGLGALASDAECGPVLQPFLAAVGPSLAGGPSSPPACPAVILGESPELAGLSFAQRIDLVKSKLAVTPMPEDAQVDVLRALASTPESDRAEIAWRLVAQGLDRPLLLRLGPCNARSYRAWVASAIPSFRRPEERTPGKLDLPLASPAFEAVRQPGLVDARRTSTEDITGHDDLVVFEERNLALVTGMDGHVWKVDLATRAGSRLAKTPMTPAGITRHPTMANKALLVTARNTGKLYATTESAGLYMVDVDTGALERILDRVPTTTAGDVEGAFEPRVYPDGEGWHAIASLDAATSRPAIYPNDLVVSRDGRRVFFTESSDSGAHGVESIAEVLAVAPGGRVWEVDLEKRAVRLAVDRLAFADGIVLDEAGGAPEALLVNELTKLRLVKIGLSGTTRGKVDVLADALPGLPDAVHRDADGNLWVALFTARTPFMTCVHRYPALKALASKLPPDAIPKQEGTGFLVLSPDANGVCTYLNQRWYEFTGQNEENGLGFGWLSAVHPDDAKMAGEVFVDANARRAPFRVDYRLRRADGTYRWAIDSASPRFGADGEYLGYVGSVIDITDRKTAEDEIRRLNSNLEERVRERTALLEEVNRELESFSYSISHDLRAPLRHIVGFAQLLEKRAASALDDKARSYLTTITEAARRGGELVDELLAFSRLGRTALRSELVPLDRLVADLRTELAPEWKDRRVEWKVATLPTVRADPALLRAAFQNLLSNAVKYTRGRDVAVIEIGARDAGAFVEVFVKDNGVGFDMEYADKLFGVFTRLHSAEEFEGVGIGLANVRRIVERHGGQVRGEGVRGAGATFTFTLPKQDA